MKPLFEHELRPAQSVSENENIVLYDYFTVTAKSATHADLLEAFGLEGLQFETLHGKYGFRYRDYYNGVNVYYGSYFESEEEKEGKLSAMIELSGQGCRVFEEHGHGDWSKIFTKFTSHEQYHITRLDVAFDDHEGLLDLERLEAMTRSRSFAARSSKQRIEYIMSTVKGEAVDGRVIYFGSKQSEVLIRIYDKAAEKGFTDRHWVRCELQLRRDRALNFIKHPEALGAKLAKVLNNYVRFIVPDGTQTNKWRCETDPMWAAFIGTLEKISIFTKKDTEYNLSRIERYVLHQPGNCIDTLIKCYGVEGFIERLMGRDTQLKPHHQAIILNYQLEQRKREAAEFEQILIWGATADG